MIERDVTAADGRLLRVREDGDPGGVPILMHAGTPNAGLLEPSDVARAHRRGIRLVSYDRPGYGGSTRHEGRNVADCASDVRAIAGSLGITRLGVWGVSGGGPHAIASAALLGGLVPAVAVLASVAPYGAPGLDYFAGMGELNEVDIRRQLDDPPAAYAKAQRDRDALLAGDVESMIEHMRTLLSSVDAEALTGPLARFVRDSEAAALAPGVDGWWDDDLAHLRDWGFGISQIRTPVLVMHGREDRFVPFAHGEWLAANIPGADARLSDDDGHISLLVDRLDEVYDWLQERMA